MLYYIVESFALPFFLSCGVLLLLHPLYTHTCTLMQLLRINYQPISYQANLMSCLSTAMGLVHEPSLPNGVVNLWQPNFGTQCGAHGQWTEPYTHRHNTHLLDDSASHSPLRRHQHHHQLAHVGQPAADARSHMKIDFSQKKNISKCMTIAVQPTSGSACYHHTP